MSEALFGHAVFYKILRDISENFENYIGKFQKLFQKISEDFREILWTFSRSISENFEKYVLKKSRAIFRRISKSTRISKIPENYSGKFQEIFRKN